MRAFRQRFSIRTIITISIASITIIFMMATGSMLFSIFTDAVVENAYVSTKEIINQVNVNLGYYISDILFVADYIKNLTREGADPPDDTLLNHIGVVLDSRPDLVSLVLFSSDGKALVNSADIPVKEPQAIVSQEWFSDALLAEGNFIFSGPHVQDLYESQYPWVVTFSQEIRFNIGDGQQTGVLMIDMNFSTISELCRQVRLGASGYIFLIDSNGDIVYHPRQQLINSGLLTEDLDTIQEHVFGRYTDVYHDQERLTIIDTVNHCRWRIVGIAYMDEIVARKRDFTTIYILVSIIGTIATLVVARTISKKISDPIKKLDSLMRKVEKGNFDVVTTVEGSLEVAHLSQTFNVMVMRIKQLTEEIVREQELKRKTEFDALQAKINPHFLYNTLDSVVWMAEQGDTQGVIRMITALARLFRISISKGRETITIAEELEHVENYLYIQKMRYKDKFEYRIELPEALRDRPTIKLIIQPIVENAIYHGIKYLQEPGLIIISVTEDHDDIVFIVRDNGVGISPEKLTLIQSDAYQSIEGRGIGVKNIDERIKLSYGKQYGLTIESELDRGTTVRVRIPKGSPIQPIKGVVKK